jgi:rod shape-determining protein MreD
MRAAFPAMALVLIFFHLLPLDTTPRIWAPPDLLLAMAFAWSLRRPDYLPVMLLAATFLLTDLAYQRPPGLMALLSVLGCEYLKSRARHQRDTTFAAEWLTVSVVLVAVLLGDRVLLGLTGVPRAQLGLSLIQLTLTILAYPLAVLASQSLFRVQRLTAAEIEAMGGRL